MDETKPETTATTSPAKTIPFMIPPKDDKGNYLFLFGVERNNRLVGVALALDATSALMLAESDFPSSEGDIVWLWHCMMWAEKEANEEVMEDPEDGIKFSAADLAKTITLDPEHDGTCAEWVISQEVPDKGTDDEPGIIGHTSEELGHTDGEGIGGQHGDQFGEDGGYRPDGEGVTELEENDGNYGTAEGADYDPDGRGEF